MNKLRILRKISISGGITMVVRRGKKPQMSQRVTPSRKSVHRGAFSSRRITGGVSHCEEDPMGQEMMLDSRPVYLELLTVNFQIPCIQAESGECAGAMIEAANSCQ